MQSRVVSHSPYDPFFVYLFMASTFDVTSDINQALKGLTALDEKNIMFAVAKAMTLTGQYAQSKLKVAMEAAIDIQRTVHSSLLQSHLTYLWKWV